MKIKKYRKNKLKIISIVFIIVVVIAAGAVYWFWQLRMTTNRSTINSSQETDQTISRNSTTTDPEKPNEDTKTVSQTTPTMASTTITAKNINNNTIQIRSVTSGAISSAGICNLTLTKDGITIFRAAATYAMPSYSTCQGFDIARADLSSGTWQITLEVTINGEKSNVTDEIVLE